MSQLFYFLGHEQYQPETLVKHAQLAEQAGFDGVFVSEHFNPWVHDKGAAGFAFSTLGAIAAVTKKIKIMTGVVTPLFRYHPAVVAQAAATIDRISNGRFILGVGTGEPINEVPLGYHYPNYSERSKRMKEALHIMHTLLSGNTSHHTGEFYKTDSVTLYSPPKHTIPILLAAGGPKTATLAAEFADGVIVSVKNTEETTEKILNPAFQKAQELHKDISITASRWTVFAQNDKDAWEALAPWRGLRAPERDKATHPHHLQHAADALPRSEILSRFTVVKTAEDFKNAYEPLIKTMKAKIVVMQTTSIDQEKTIQFLGSKVLPLLS